MMCDIKGHPTPSPPSPPLHLYTFYRAPRPKVSWCEGGPPLRQDTFVFESDRENSTTRLVVYNTVLAIG